MDQFTAGYGMLDQSQRQICHELFNDYIRKYRYTTK